MIEEDTDVNLWPPQAYMKTRPKKGTKTKPKIMKSSHPLNPSLLILHPHILVSSRSSHLLYFLFILSSCVFSLCLKKIGKMIFYLFLIREDITFSFFLLSCCKFIKRKLLNFSKT